MRPDPAALLDLLLPRVCAGCGEPTAPAVSWCPRCRRAFDRGGPVDLPGLPDLPPVLALAPYRGAARAALIAYKERGRRDLARPLAAALRATIARHGLPACAVVPAPSRRSAARVRGGDHVARLARALVAGTGAGPVSRALALTRGARDSVGLDADARAANLAAHLRLRHHARPPPGRPVLLLDDVLTTGATARAATALLTAAGHPVAAVVVLTAAGHPIGHGNLSVAVPSR